MKKTAVRIPNELFPAVSLARKLIREGGVPNYCVSHAAKTYGVDASDVAMWMARKREPETRQTSGKWYFAAIYCSNEACGEETMIELRYGRTVSKSAEERKISRECENRTRREDTGSVYSNVYTFLMCDTLYNTKEDAEKAALFKLVQKGKNVL